MKTYISRTVLILLAVGLFSCNQTPKVLVIVGGHEYDTTEFFEMFHSLEGIVFDSVSYPQAMDLLQSNKTDDYDLLLFYDFIPDMPLNDSNAFIHLTTQGKSMLFLHHAICTFQEWDGYKEIVGGKYMMPGYHADNSLHSGYRHDIDLPITVIDHSHPVTTGVEDFIIHDEGYSNIQISKEIHPLFGTSHPDCSPLVGWVSQANKSTCLYLMFGHDKLAYNNESLLQILNNSIHWLADLD